MIKSAGTNISLLKKDTEVFEIFENIRSKSESKVLKVSCTD